MMFDGAQFFRGLTAWFSTSVPARQKSLWMKKGGLENDDFLKADYIFSSNAAADDTVRIFASSKYESEELTVFNSSLIEDCVINNNGSLNGKYLGGFILIQPQYQKELDSFQNGKCPRIYSLKGVNGDRMRGSHAIGIKKVVLPTKSTERHYNDSSDEWDFVDESHTAVRHLSDVRRLSKEQLNYTAKKNLTTSVKEQQPSNSCAVDKTNHSTVKHKALAHQENAGRDLHTSLKETSYSTEKHSTMKAEQRKRHLNDSSKTHNTRKCADSDKGSWRCPEDCREMNSSSQSAGSPMEIDSCLPDEKEKQHPVESNNKHHVLSKGASISPSSFKLKFLSSMDNGFLHIDDIVLPDIPIDDFVPNMNGCRVEFK